MDRVSFYGISKDMYDKSGNKHNDVGKAALDKIREDMQKKKSSLGAFELKVSPIAGGSDRMAAVRIIPNLEWIKANTAKLNSKGGISEPGLFTPNEAAAIAKHGITYFMNNKKMNSNMYKQSYQSPMESYVETFGKYELNSIGGDPMKSFKVEKNTLGTGDYITTVTYPLFNPDTGKLEKQVYRNNVGFTGQNLENLRDGMIYNFMDDADIQNTLQYNNFENLGQ
jgi:hypothetical protein